MFNILYKDMKFQIYNTMTHKKEEFIPRIDEGKSDFVWIYSCWPTVYRDPHIWNMRAYIFTDTLRCTLEYILWYPLRSVMNLTDVWHLTSDDDHGQDKMEKWAQRENMTVRELADKYIDSFKRYLKMLNIEEYNILCRATDHIKEQIDMTKTLEDKWYTYIIPWDWVYMDTSKVEDYGALSNLTLDWMQQWARIENDAKKNKTDFALWKFAPEWEKRQMERDSPWWLGFPWWHLECSAMSSKYLWEQFDIHTWWVDHISIHHPNEIAQSECCFGKKPWVKYRMHNQFLNLWWKKSSKSAGGLITIDTLIEKWYDPIDFRYLCINWHYRSFLDYNENMMTQAKHARANLIKKLSKSEHTELKASNYKKLETQLETQEAKDFLNEALSDILDDLNTPKLLATINKALQNPNSEIISVIHRLDQSLLRLDLFKSDAVETIEAPEEIKKLAEDRLYAKQNKDRANADKIRDDMKSRWRNVLDTKDWFELNKL